MLYKPTSPSPCINNVILSTDNTQKHIKFQASVFNGDKIINTRLRFIKGDDNYYFYDKSSDFTVNINSEGDYGNTISWETNSDDFSQYLTDKDCYRIYMEGIYRNAAEKIHRRECPSTTTNKRTLNDIFQNDTLNVWQMRCYSEQSNNIVGYGMVEDNATWGTYSNGVFTSTTADEYTHCYVKIRPHTNIFSKYALNSSGGYSNPSPSGEKHIDASIFSQLYINYDDNAKYSLRVNGKTLPIVDYMYRCPTNSSITTDDIDGYGNPLYAYVILENSTGCYQGTQYQICSNFVDSDEFYYSIVSPPSVSITVDEYELNDDNSLDNPIVINTSAPNIDVKYNSNLAIVNNYKFTVFAVNDKKSEQIYTSKNIYSSQIYFDFQYFFNDTIYLINLSITDSNQTTIQKNIYLKTDYGESYNSSYMNVKYLPAHGSAIVNWSNNISITPTIYGDINFNEHALIPQGGIVTYDTVDGMGSLDLDDDTIVLKIKIGDDFKGQSVMVNAGNGRGWYIPNAFLDIETNGEHERYRKILSFNGLGFDLTCLWGKSADFEARRYPYYASDYYKNDRTWYKSDWSGQQDKIKLALKSSEDNTAVNYIYDEQNSQEWDFGDKLNTIYYWHEEDYITSQYFLIIIHGLANLEVIPLSEEE